MKIIILFLALAAAPLVIGTPHRGINFRDAMRKLKEEPNFTRKGRGPGGPDDFLPLPFPYEVTVRNISLGTPLNSCSGSTLSEEWVLTAAHCVDVEAHNPGIFEIVAGDQDIDAVDDSEQIVHVSQIIVHEGYNRFTSTNDVALLKLATPLAFNDFVQPIPLPQKNQIASGSCNIFGATVLFAPDTDCIGVLRAGQTSNDCLICAELISGTMRTCEGNSGSPLVCSDGAGNDYLAGIRGSDCGSAESPILYDEVSCFVDWINLQMAP